MRLRMAIALIAATGTLSISSAQAAPVCADLFRQASPVARLTAPVQKATAPVARAVAPVVRPLVLPAARIMGEVSSLAQRLRAPRFKIEKFDAALAEYRERGVEDIERPRSREARLAFLHYVTTTQGRNPYDLEAWARQASPKEFRELVKSIGRFNTDKGFSPTQIDSIYWKLFTYSATSPNSLRNIRRIGLTQMDRIALEQWTTKELASQSAVEAFERLGLIRDQGLRGRMMDLIRSHPNVTTNLVTAGMMIFEKHLLGSPITAPSYSRLRVTKLASELRSLVEENGFDATYPILKQRYGNLARFDRSFYFARRAVTVGLMAYMLANLVPTVVQGVIPPHLVTSDMNAVEITEAVIGYYSDLATAIAADRIYGTDEREISVRTAGSSAATPSALPPPAAAPGSVKKPAPVDLQKVSANRVTITFDQQLAQEKKPAAQPKTAPPSTDLGSPEQSAKALEDNLDYLNSLDFSNPTEG